MTFETAINQVKILVLEEFDRQIESQQLVYHNREHIAGVQRRALQIFDVVCPNDDRLRLILELCAIAHDMIQIFQPGSDLPRKRESGMSEKATLKQLMHYVDVVGVPFTELEIKAIEQSILVTICSYDSTEQAIYQADLANGELSLIARTIALADIGALAIEGIEAYHQEGRLLFLEENPNLGSGEDLRQRLLRRACFQVNFARSRFARLPQELIGFPPETIPILMRSIFRFANSKTLAQLEAMTPTAAETSLEDLLEFFRFSQGDQS